MTAPGGGARRHSDPRRRYAIRVEGALDPARWSAWFDGMTLRNAPCPECAGGEETVIEGEVADQCALHGLLAKVRDLHLTLISVERW